MRLGFTTQIGGNLSLLRLKTDATRGPWGGPKRRAGDAFKKGRGKGPGGGPTSTGKREPPRYRGISKGGGVKGKKGFQAGVLEEPSRSLEVRRGKKDYLGTQESKRDALLPSLALGRELRGEGKNSRRRRKD